MGGTQGNWNSVPGNRSGRSVPGNSSGAGNCSGQFREHRVTGTQLWELSSGRSVPGNSSGEQFLYLLRSVPGTQGNWNSALGTQFRQISSGEQFRGTVPVSAPVSSGNPGELELSSGNSVPADQFRGTVPVTAPVTAPVSSGNPGELELS